MTTHNFRDDPRFLAGVFDEAANHSRAYLHQVGNHQAKFFVRLLAGFETLIANWGQPEEKTGHRYDVKALQNEPGLSVISLTCRARSGRLLSHIDVAIGGDANVYFYKRPTGLFSRLFQRTASHDSGFFPAHADAVVKGEQTQLILEVTNGIRTALKMLDPKYIGWFYAERCSVELAAGSGHDLYAIRNDLV